MTDKQACDPKITGGFYLFLPDRWCKEEEWVPRRQDKPDSKITRVFYLFLPVVQRGRVGTEAKVEGKGENQNGSGLSLLFHSMSLSLKRKGPTDKRTCLG